MHVLIHKPCTGAIKFQIDKNMVEIWQVIYPNYTEKGVINNGLY